MNTQDWLDFADHLEVRAASCNDEVANTNDLYYRYHLRGRASAFIDCAWMIRQRLEADQ